MPIAITRHAVRAYKPGTGAPIDARPAGRGRREINGVNIGAKVMTRDTVEVLRLKDEFRRELLGLVDDPRHRGLGDLEISPQLADGASTITASEQRFVAGHSGIHKRVCAHLWIPSQPEKASRSGIRFWVGVAAWQN